MLGGLALHVLRSVLVVGRAGAGRLLRVEGRSSSQLVVLVRLLLRH